MPINEPVVDPNIRIPRAPTIPVPRVAQERAFEPSVITPRRTDITALSSLATNLQQAAQTGNQVAIEYAKQAGYVAPLRDADGNLRMAPVPIVGDAAIAYHDAVKYTALSQGESEAKQKDLVLSKQFLDNPQGYLDAANAFREQHVKQYTQAFGGDVGAALGRSIDTATTNNFRFLVLQQQAQIKRNFGQATDASLESMTGDWLSANRDDPNFPNTPQGQALYRRIIGTMELQVQSPLTAVPREVNDLRVKKLLLDTGAAQTAAGVSRILNDPSGGVAVATESLNSIATDPKYKPEERQAYVAAGQKVIKDFQENLVRQVHMEDMAQKMRDESFESTVIKDSKSGNPPTITENQIANWPGASSAARMRMLGWEKRIQMPEPMARSLAGECD